MLFISMTEEELKQNKNFPLFIKELANTHFCKLLCKIYLYRYLNKYDNIPKYQYKFLFISVWYEIDKLRRTGESFDYTGI